MKELFNFPQKKGKNYVSMYSSKVLIELNEIKIKNFQQLNDNNGYYIESIIPIKNNETSIDKIKEIDNLAKETILSNYNEWFDNDEEKNIDEFINNIYINSYTKDLPITLILSNKISTDILINDEEKELYELIEFINSNKKNKNYIINVDIIFLGIYINKTSIINKWAIKYINIEIINDDDTIDWNRKEIEEEWKYDLINYEEEIKLKIINMNKNLIKANELYNEIIKETNIKIWENKLVKLKTIIF
jgi:hypothetical protein